jgi:hypothetical protein
MLALFRIGAFISNKLRQKWRGFGGTRAPDDLATRGCVPLFADLRQPGTEELILLFVSTNAECFEVPAILAVVLLS